MDEASVGAGNAGEAHATVTPAPKQLAEASDKVSRALAIGDELARIAQALQQLEVAHTAGYHSMSVIPRRKLEGSTLYRELESRQKELRAALVAMG